MFTFQRPNQEGRGRSWLRRPGVAALAVSLIGLASAFSVRAELSSPVPPTLEDAKKSDVTVQALRGNLSILFGSGGNIAVLSAPDGLFMVDAGIAVSRQKIEAALKSVGPGPVRYVVNSHYHWDHSDGNEWLHSTGAEIIAHKNTLKHLSATTRVIEWGYTFPPAPEAARPTVLVDREKTMAFGGETIVIRNFGSGHTDGDLAIYFSKADVLMTGDIWWNGLYPFIDYGAGGGINGMITWADALLKMTTDKTIIVPGHGQVGTRAQLQAFRQMLVTSRDRVGRLKKQGLTLGEILEKKPTAPFDKQYGNFWIDPTFFTTLVYNGL